MTSRVRPWLLASPVAVIVLGTAPSAIALNQSVHYDITYDTCRSVGGPDGFCEQVATFAHNVDNNEFFDMAAHSQMAPGQTACDGANYAIWRVFWFGTKIRPLTQQAAIFPTHASISGLAEALGRALHTVQDNCAHAGMTNAQHAWMSIQDFCTGSETSPDLRPEALQCGKEETAAVFEAVFSVLHDNGAVTADLDDVDDYANHSTSLSDGCHYLADAYNWNGEDRRWDNTIVRPYMRHELIDAITNDNARHGWVCSSAPDGLLVSYDNDVDVSDGPNSCGLVHLACLGKADGDESGIVGDVPDAPGEGGCNVSGESKPPWTGLVLIGGFWLALRRRRRSRADD